MAYFASYKMEIGIAVTVAVALASVAGIGAVSLAQSSPQTTNTISSATSSSTVASVASTTAQCGSPGAYCGGFEIETVNLTTDGNSSVLQIQLKETGNMWIGSATVYVNDTVIGVPLTSRYLPPGNILLNVQPGQTAVLVLTIPSSTLIIQSGRTYAVTVYDWEGPPGQRASAGNFQSIFVTAA